MYLSMTAAIFTWLLGVVLVSVGVNAILFCFAKYYTFTFSTILSNIVFYFVLGLFMSGPLAVAMMITGTTMSNLLIYAFLMLFPRYLVLMFQSSLDYGIPILPNVMEHFTLFSFERFLPLSWAAGDVLNDGYLIDPAMLIYSAVVGLLMFALAGVLYHFRRSESATKSAPNHFAQHIYRTAFTTAMAITIPFAILMDGLNEIVILLVFLTFIVHILYELLTTRRIKKMVKTLPLIVIPFVVAVIFFCSVLGAKAYVYSVRPDAEDVTSIAFFDRYSGIYGEYKLQNTELTDRDAVEIAVRGLHDTLDDVEYPDGKDWDWYTVSYKLKSGRTIQRYIRMTTEDWKAICTSEGTKDIYLSLPEDEDVSIMEIRPFPLPYYSSYVSIDIDPRYEDEYQDINETLENKKLREEYEAAQRKVWTLFKEEYEALSDAEKMELLSCTGYMRRADTYYIEILLKEYVNANGSYYTRYARSFYYQLLPEYTPRTIDFIMSLYGSEESVIAALRQMKAEDIGGTTALYLKENGVYQRFYVDTEDFLTQVTLDAHLFDEGGYDTLVIINGYEFWLNLTKEELENVLSDFGSIVVYDKYA